MGSDIVLSRDSAAGPPDLSQGKRQQLYRESLAGIAHGIMFGWKADLYIAFNLFNIAHNKLYEEDGLDWTRFVEKTGMSKTSIGRYLRIGERVREMVKASGATPLLPHVVTQRDFNTAFEPFFSNGRSYTLRDLAKSSTDLSNFREYLDGAKGVDDADAIKLLNARNKKSADAIAQEREQELREEKIADDIDHDQSAFYRSEAAQRGYRWNGEDHRYESEDGTKLSKKQLAEFLTSAEALRPVKLVVQALVAARQEIKQAIKMHGEAYWDYREHRADEGFNARSTAEFQRAKQLCDQIETLRAELFAGRDDD